MEDVLAIVCPGQGAQSPGFLSSWLDIAGAHEALTRLSSRAGCDLVTHGTRSDEDTIKDTAVAQPLIVGAGLLALDALSSALGSARSVLYAGHSVGEVTAAAGAGVLDPVDAMSFVATRGAAMASASAVTPTGMSAVLGGDPDEVIGAIEGHGLTAANRNGGGQVVAAGTLDQLAALSAAPPARARVIPLKVAGAFHTHHMSPAREALAAAAGSLATAAPSATLLSNRDGTAVADGTDGIERLVAQVVSPVRWDLCMAAMADLGVTGLLEPPPAGTLVGLAKRGLPGVATYALKTPDDLPGAVDFIAEHGGTR